MKFNNKALTLKKIKCKNAIIPKLVIIQTKDFFNKKEKILKKVIKNFSRNTLLIVRSSSSEEDSNLRSNAGKFESVGMIQNKENEINRAMSKVINSYKKNKKKSIIFVQKMISDCAFSGVITTCVLSNQAPYYVINYFEGKDTSATTSGKANTETYYQFKYSNNLGDKKFEKIIKLAQELETKFKNNYLDIEFGVKNNVVYLFQVRPIVFKKKKHLFNKELFKKSLIKLKNKIIKLKDRNHNLFGNTSYFGIMPDWNPAEMIGIKPKALASSLYQELITDFIWAKNREKYGFNDLTSSHLMSMFLGTPYIDIRVDFNSWLPKNLSNNTKEKLVNYYLNIFKKNHNYHDKIEFKILFTCFNAETNDKINKIKNSQLNLKEKKKIKNELRKITINSIQNINEDIKKIKILQQKQEDIKKSKIYSIDKIYWLIEDCKRYGTEPFAGLARSGFIAVELLNSMENKKIIEKKEKDLFFQSIESITKEIINDQNLTKKKFCEKYGHLRPNTYDILSKNYKENYDYFFNKKLKNFQRSKKIKFKFSEKSKLKIKKYLKTLDKKITLEEIINFVRKGIYYREYSKFIFTKSIDYIFQEIKFLSKRNKININKLSHINIKIIKELYYNLNNKSVKNILVNNINENYEDFKFNQLIKLPQIIINPNDVFYFKEKTGTPNFFGNKTIVSKIYFLDRNNLNELEDKIICIRGADPGYDFIFNHKISGLITEYGGANSHMSIRCSELNISAAIGVGSIAFNNIIKSNKVYLDPITKKIDLF